MLNVALVGLLASTLAIGGGDSKNPQTGEKPAANNAVPGIFISSDAPASATPNTVQDTYAFGQAASRSPLRLWANYGQGDASDIWDTNGDDQDLTLANTAGKIVTRRAAFGAEIGLPVGFFGFGLGIGGQLTLAQNEFETTGGPIGPVAAGGNGDVSGDFGLQQAKLYGTAGAGPISLHGGYIFDIGSDREYGAATLGQQQTFGTVTLPAGTPLFVNASGTILPQPFVGAQTGFAPLQVPTQLSTSDGRDALFFGADFDYAPSALRLFGAVDYYKLFRRDDEPQTAFNENTRGDDFVNAMFGLGVRLSVFEIGAALQMQTSFSQPLVQGLGTAPGIGGSAATVAPYLRISPPQIPASIFIKGAVHDEYTEFGYALGGGNSPKPAFGFTAGLSVGFN